MGKKFKERPFPAPSAQYEINLETIHLPVVVVGFIAADYMMWFEERKK